MEGNKRVRRRRRNTVERLKNLLILLLTLSAVVLTVRVLMFNGLVDKGPRGWLDHLLSLLDPGQSVPADDPEATGQSGAAAQPVRDHHDALRARTRFVHAGIRVREQVAGKRLPLIGREGSLAHAQAGELVRRALHERGRLQPRAEVALVHVRRDAERHHANQEHHRHRHNHKRDAPYTKLPCRPVLHAPAFTAPSRDLQYTRNTRHAIFP